jgi:hypothetical protein
VLGVFIFAIAAGCAAWLLSSIVLGEQRVTSLVVPIVVAKMPRRGEVLAKPVRERRAKAPSIPLPRDRSNERPRFKLPRFALPKVALPRIKFPRFSRVRSAGEPIVEQTAVDTIEAPLADAAPVEIVSAPISENENEIIAPEARARARWFPLSMPRLPIKKTNMPPDLPAAPRWRLPKLSLKALFGSRSKTVTMEEELTAPVTAAPEQQEELESLPAWLDGLNVSNVPPINRRVWLVWLRANSLAGEAREAFLRLVEESDPALISVVRLARLQNRPLALHTLDEAEQWMQRTA